MQLTERDWRAFELVKDFGYATTTHIAKLCGFPNPKVAARRLQILSRGGYLHHLERPSKGGKGEFVYYLSPKALKELGKEGKSSHIPSLKELSHTLSINDVILLLQQACKAKSLRLSYFTDSRLRQEKGFHDYVQSAGLRPMYPDMVFALQNDQGQKALFLVEIERTSISIRSKYGADLRTKVRTMASYIDRHVYHFFSEAFEYGFHGFRYLMVTTGNRSRLTKIIAECGDPHQDFDFVWLAPMEAMSAQCVFRCIWRKLNPKDHQYYSITGNACAKSPGAAR